MKRWIPAILACAIVLPTTAFAQRWSWPEKSENLTVLPDDTNAAALRTTMTGFARALGVRCSHCHVGEEGVSLATYDFVSDEKPAKLTARKMMEMLGGIRESLGDLPSAASAVEVDCVTCHRGRPRPLTLEAELHEVYAEAGVDSTLAHYDALRESFYGRGAYDFGELSLISLGSRLLEEGDPAAAGELLRRNLALFPESTWTRVSLAEVYVQEGDRARAQQELRAALELDPSNRRLQQRLEELQREPSADQGP